MFKMVVAKAGLENQYNSIESKIIKAANIDYSVRSYLLLFFSYSFVGWVWELILFGVLEQQIVNTGMLHGPWLPIYGVGGVLALELFKNIRNNPVKTFFSIMVAAGILEYAAHFSAEKIFGFAWWDYSGYMFSINDRICLEGLTVFAILGCFAIYVISPKLDTALKRVNIQYQDYITICLVVFFVVDLIFSLINPNIQNLY